jgi:hypothetical protein
VIGSLINACAAAERSRRSRQKKKQILARITLRKGGGGGKALRTRLASNITIRLTTLGRSAYIYIVLFLTDLRVSNMALKRATSLIATKPLPDDDIMITVSDDVTRRIDTLIRRKMPGSEEAWNRHLCCEEVVTCRLRRRLILEGVGSDSSVPAIFDAYAQRVGDLASQSANTNSSSSETGTLLLHSSSSSSPSAFFTCSAAGYEEDFLRVVAIATGEVLLREYEATQMLETTEHDTLRREVHDGIRNCFWRGGSSAKMSEMVVKGYRAAVVRGLRLLMDLHGHLGFRAHELPFHGEFSRECFSFIHTHIHCG